MRGAHQFLTPGVLQKAEFYPEGSDNPSATLIIGESRVAWRLRIYCQGDTGGEQTGWTYVGSVRTLPWPSGGDRAAAIACIPGARQWAVDGRPEDHTSQERLRVDLMSSNTMGGPAGVSGVEGISLAGARHLDTISGVTGAALVPGPVVGFTAIADAAGGTITIIQPGDTVPRVITLPPGSSYKDHYGDDSADFVALTFAGTLMFSVTYEVAGDGVDNL